VVVLHTVAAGRPGDHKPVFFWMFDKILRLSSEPAAIWI